MSTGNTLARGLGFFSLGLGLAQVLAPDRFAEFVGVRPNSQRLTATRAVGARELGAACGLLASPKPVIWPWLRVAGDVMDIGLVGRAFTMRDTRRERAAMAILALVGITAVDVVAGLVMTNESGPQGTATMTPTGARRIRRAVTIQASRDEAYSYWRDFANLPRFMRHLEDVRVIDDRRSHWRAKAPAGSRVEWDAEITEDRPGEAIAWRSVGASQIANSGRVRFVDAPGDRGTEVHVELEYAPPFGSIGVVFAKLLGEEPAQQAADDLRHFKQIVETGRVPWSEATIGDRKARQRPAQPPEQPVTEPVAAYA
jgi:uncharacterized membrane protein